jgi:hypothetical protein
VPNFLDRNANSPLRDRRNAQRLRTPDAAGSLKVSAPITNAGGLALSLFSTGGLQVSSSALSLKLADTSLSLTAGGVALNLATNSGLTVSGGLKVNLSNVNTGLQTNANGLFIGTAASINVSGGTISVNMKSGGGLQIDDATGIYVRGVQVLSAARPSPADGDFWYNTTNNGFEAREKGATFGGSWVAFQATADGIAVANTSAATVSYNGPIFPANFWTAGKSMRVSFSGNYSTTGTPTLNVGLDLATNVDTYLNGNTAWTTANNAAGAQFHSDFIITCRSTGVSGSFVCHGVDLFNTAVANFLPNATATTIDTTQVSQLKLVFKWSAASPSNTVTGQQFSVEVLDPA